MHIVESLRSTWLNFTVGDKMHNPLGTQGVLCMLAKVIYKL